jgi:hypothetical protein
VSSPRKLDAEIVVDPFRPGARHARAIRLQARLPRRTRDENGGGAGDA